MNRLARLPALLLPALLLGTGCLPPLDGLGADVTVTETESRQSEARLEDDVLEDKHPTYDADLTVTESFGQCEVVLNKSAAITRLDVLPLDGAYADLDGALFPTRGEALAAAAAIEGADVIPSIEVFSGMLKPFDDGLYAAVELAVEDGVDGLLPAKRDLLHGLLAAALDAAAQASETRRPYLEAAAVHLGAALLAGGEDPALPADLRPRAEAALARFDADLLLSRPMGFYGWSPALEGLYRQDRFLQNRLGNDSDAEVGMFAAMAALLQADPDLEAEYARVLALYGGLTNPYASYPVSALFDEAADLSALDDVPGLAARFRASHPAPFVCSGVTLAFVPASSSRDSDYFASLYCANPPPAGTSLIDVLIDGIRTGAVDLVPDEASGWYDWQLYALETLLLPNRGPESDHLLLTAAYKQKLVDTFKSLITQHRETHVKQLAVPMAGSAGTASFELYPKFDAEPFPTFYLRTARGYRFLGNVLTAVLGEGVLEATHRLNEDGTRAEAPLAAELDRAARRAYGLYLLTAASVGLRPEDGLLADELADLDAEACVEAARTWLDGWQDDPDVLADPRVIVPTFGGDTITYWATLGVKALRVEAEFAADHAPEVVDSGWCELEGVVPHEYVLLTEVMREVRLPASTPPPSRETLRRVCDENADPDAIVSALEAL